MQLGSIRNLTFCNLKAHILLKITTTHLNEAEKTIDFNKCHLITYTTIVIDTNSIAS